MSDFRKLQAKLEQIDESYHSRLAAAIDDLVTNNPNVEPVKLVAMVRAQFGDNAAKYLSDQLEDEGDFLDYDPQARAANIPIRKHMKKYAASHPSDANWPHPVEEDEYSDDEFDQTFVPDDIHAKIVADMSKMLPGYEPGAYGPGDEDNQYRVLAWNNDTDHEIEMLFNLDTMSLEGSEDHFNLSNPFEGIEESFGDWIDDLTTPSDESEHRLDHDPSFTNEEPISQQVKNLLAQGKSVISRIAGASGVVYSANPEDGTIIFKDQNFGEKVGFKVDEKEGLEIKGNIDHYSIVQFADESIDEGVADWMKRLGEAIIEVPPELRGDSKLTGNATSADVEKFLSDLGPDDDVSHDVVDPETGELLDWPTTGLHRDEPGEADWRRVWRHKT